MLLPVRAKNPPEGTPYATVALIAINVIVYAVTSQYGLIIREDVLGAWAFKSADFPSVTLLASMFLHFDLFHILGNMWFLYLFGFAVEGRMKSGRFLLLYFLSGFAGDLMHHFMVGINEPNMPSLGASGAIMGVVGAAIFMFPHSKINMFYWLWVLWYGVAEWSMWAVGLYYLGIDVLTTIAGFDTGVATLAHIGGAMAGFFTAMAMRIHRDDESASEAKATFSDFNNLYALKNYDVKQIALANPENSEAALAWVWTCIGTGRMPSEDSMRHFERHLPQLVRSGSVIELADVLTEYGGRSGRFHARYLVDVALRAEKDGEPRVALSLLESALVNPYIALTDRETALYQSALIHEMWFQNYVAAMSLYRQVYEEFGGSPMADHAVARYKIVSPLVNKRH